MGKSNLNRAKRADELSHAQLQRADLLIRQTYEKSQVLFLKLQQTLMEIQTLRSETLVLHRALRLFLSIAEEDSRFAEAVRMATINETQKRKE